MRLHCLQMSNISPRRFNKSDAETPRNSFICLLQSKGHTAGGAHCFPFIFNETGAASSCGSAQAPVNSATDFLQSPESKPAAVCFGVAALLVTLWCPIRRISALDTDTTQQTSHGAGYVRKCPIWCERSRVQLSDEKSKTLPLDSVSNTNIKSSH